MSSVNFYIDRADRKNERPILLSCVAKGKRFRFYTKLKIAENFWDRKLQQVRKTKPGHEEINSILESYKEVINQIQRESLFKKETLSADQIRQRFEIAIGKEKPFDDFHSVYSRYLKLSHVSKTHTTVKGFITCYNKLKAFEAEREYELTFESINKNFYDLYMDFLLSSNYLNNTIGKFIKSLKFFMNYATDVGVNKNLAFKKFKVFNEEVDLIFLTNDELMRLFNLPIIDESLY